nr:MAG TPA_asm: hypothetical protein [Caudoviricetes sp.]
MTKLLNRQNVMELKLFMIWNLMMKIQQLILIHQKIENC